MAFSQETISDVWRKGNVVPDYNSDVWRKDECGAWISHIQYGNRDNQYGWEIDHITPVSRGGGDAITNLRPLQWRNNAHKQDGKLGCAVTADGDHNVST